MAQQLPEGQSLEVKKPTKLPPTGTAGRGKPNNKTPNQRQLTGVSNQVPLLEEIMASNIVSLADVSNQKKVAIVSRYLAKYAEFQRIKQELEEMKVNAIDVLGEGQYETTRGKLTIKWVERAVLDQGKAKALLTPSQLAGCFKQTAFYDLRLSLKGA